MALHSHPVHLEEGAFFTFLITLGFHDLNECGGKLLYFLSNVVCLYVLSFLTVDRQAVETSF